MPGTAPRGNHILFVDDEESIRITLPAILRKAGFEVVVAASVQEALIEINSHRFDALISDLNITDPGDGFLVISAMRHMQPECVNVILTGYPAIETALQAIHSQVDDYLVKPVQVEALVDGLKSRLEKRGKKPPLGATGIVELLKENKAQISAQLDGMAVFVDPVIEIAEGEPGQVDVAIREVAEKHGQLRKKTGRTPSDVASEFRSFEEVIYRVIEGKLTPIGLMNLVSDLKRVNRAIHLLMEESLAVFQTGST